jgi:hypothetical protein
MASESYHNQHVVVYKFNKLAFGVVRCEENANIGETQKIFEKFENNKIDNKFQKHEGVVRAKLLL